MENKNKIRAMLDLIEIYQHVQKHYEVTKTLDQCQEDLTNFLIENRETFKENKDMQKLYSSITGNIAEDIKNLKEQGAF